MSTLVEAERLALLLPSSGYCCALPFGFKINGV
jgi:hypothetical protein